MTCFFDIIGNADKGQTGRPHGLKQQSLHFTLLSNNHKTTDQSKIKVVISLAVRSIENWRSNVQSFTGKPKKILIMF